MNRSISFRSPAAPLLALFSAALVMAGCGPTLGDYARAETLGCGGLFILAINVYALINIIGSSASTGAKVVWCLVVWLMPVLGFIIWFLAGPKK
jgi:hypothetical protein